MNVWLNLAVLSLVMAEHETPCSPHDHAHFCLNGGTCFLLPDLQHKRCGCKTPYIGHRCAQIDTSAVHNTAVNCLTDLKMCLKKYGHDPDMKDLANICPKVTMVDECMTKVKKACETDQATQQTYQSLYPHVASMKAKCATYKTEHGSQGAIQTAIVCQEDTLHIDCSSNGGTITIRSVVYGRRDKTTCSKGRPTWQLRNTNCDYPKVNNKVFAAVRNRCNGERTCTQKLGDSVGGIPCFGTWKYSDIRFTCDSVPMQTVIVCQEDNLNLDCSSNGGTIKVKCVKFGRRDKTTCSKGRPRSQLQNTKCNNPKVNNKVFAAVSNRCDGVPTCTLKLGRGTGGNPCEGTWKYSEVRFSCESGPMQTAIVCQEDNLNLDCSSKGGTIKVKYVKFGRRDKTTCSKGRPKSQIQNTNCDNPKVNNKVFNAVSNRCDGVPTCTLKLGRGTGGNPCEGTWKYSEVRFSCESASAGDRARASSADHVAPVTSSTTWLCSVLCAWLVWCSTWQ